MSVPALGLSDIEDRLRMYPEWSLRDGSLVRDYTFPDFATALRFLIVVGRIAEQQNHHPEIWNLYNRVRLSYNTHDAQGITALDFAAIAALDAVRNP